MIVLKKESGQNDLLWNKLIANLVLIEGRLKDEVEK
ncbi:hypothetical protein SAMN05421852_103122 [Thermoflavimicrobium dichotomicum]|uniref:Uncharacterized protein n=1 Tax=Thermoflavimicrobium dichotomicum TaxID=46223 RepID=A0A1I3MLX2_9BACL|nr:hypothetical protein SAMN05421852_103122 [Thermoflavimicrobium dichotomicum]